jgi:hypothetical protein
MEVDIGEARHEGMARTRFLYRMHVKMVNYLQAAEKQITLLLDQLSN